MHWIVYDLPLQAKSIAAAVASGARVGRNSMLRSGWAGCAPPKGDTPHRYFFQLFALDRAPRLPVNAGRSAVIEALRDHVIGFGLLVGTYQR